MVKANILLVDDEAGMRDAVRHVLMDLDALEVIAAASGEEALGIMDQREIDVLISDYQMPGIDGLELMERVRHTSPDTVRILFSGRVDLTAVARAFNGGLIHRFVLKPWQDDEEIVSAVHLALRSRQALLQTRWLVCQYRELRLRVDDLERAVMATALAVRPDSLAAQDADFLRRRLRGTGGSHD